MPKLHQKRIYVYTSRYFFQRLQFMALFKLRKGFKSSFLLFSMIIIRNTSDIDTEYAHEIGLKFTL